MRGSSTLGGVVSPGLCPHGSRASLGRGHRAAIWAGAQRAWLALAALAWLLLGCPARAQEGLQVFCYHQICQHPRNEMETTPANFEAHLRYLQENGYQIVGLQEARAFLEGKRRLKKPVLLTFDDGYLGVYKYAFPLLKRYRARAAVFLVVSQLGARNGTAHLTEKQVVEMHRSGLFDFGSHTYNLHVPLPEFWAESRISRYRLKRDLIRSREVLQKLLKTRVVDLAWPYGHYDEPCIQVAREAGFKSIYTTDYGPNRVGAGTYRIRRVRLSSEYDTVGRLREKLSWF